MSKALRRLWHRVEHRFGWNLGVVDTWWENGVLMTAFRCQGCGRRSHRHIATLPHLGTPPEEMRQ